MAAEAHALAHTVYWTSSRGYFSATGRPVEKNSTGRPVEWFYWTSSRTDDLCHSDSCFLIYLLYLLPKHDTFNLQNLHSIRNKTLWGSWTMQM